VARKVRGMKTDPARVRRSDPGEPDNCPVYSLHAIYSDASVLESVAEGCRDARIGCVDCKQPLIDAINAEQAVMVERSRPFEEQPDLVHRVLWEGSEKARAIAQETLDDVRASMRIAHR